MDEALLEKHGYKLIKIWLAPDEYKLLIKEKPADMLLVAYISVLVREKIKKIQREKREKIKNMELLKNSYKKWK